MLFVHDMFLDVVRCVGDCGLRAFPGEEAVLLVVDREFFEGFIHVPSDKPFQALEEVVRQRDGSEGFGCIVSVLAGFGNEDDLCLFPCLGCVPEVDACLIDSFERAYELWGQVFKYEWLDAIGSGAFLLLEAVKCF